MKGEGESCAFGDMERSAQEVPESIHGGALDDLLHNTRFPRGGKANQLKIEVNNLEVRDKAAFDAMMNQASQRRTFGARSCHAARDHRQCVAPFLIAEVKKSIGEADGTLQSLVVKTEQGEVMGPGGGSPGKRRGHAVASPAYSLRRQRPAVAVFYGVRCPPH